MYVYHLENEMYNCICFIFSSTYFKKENSKKSSPYLLNVLDEWYKLKDYRCRQCSFGPYKCKQNMLY